MEFPNRNVLIVDDEELVLNALRRVLGKENLNIFTTRYKFEAIHIFKKNEISVIVSDYRMPVMDGIELLEEVKKISPKTVRILITGSNDIKEMEDSINGCGVSKIIIKPWYDRELKSSILSAVRIYNE
ncbi:MAG: response regulator [Proteobacteria bacterium]|nr:response regulator [Pseudomonadota bacterium]